MEAFSKRRASESAAGVERTSADASLRDRGRARLGLPLKGTGTTAAIHALESTLDWQRIASSCAPLSPSARRSIVAVWVPLRHVSWAASLNAAGLTASNSSRYPATQSVELSVLHLQHACLFSALGWALGGAGALRSARRIWLEDPVWQALRRYVEDALALRDPHECAFALSLMLDGLVRPLLGSSALQRCAGDETSALASYFDALIESSATAWVRADTAALTQWAARAASAALPVVERVWGPDTDEKLGAVMEKLVAPTLPDGGAVGMRCV